MLKKFLRTLSILGFLSLISIRLDANTYVDYTELSEDRFKKVYGKEERITWQVKEWWNEPRTSAYAHTTMTTYAKYYYDYGWEKWYSYPCGEVTTDYEHIKRTSDGESCRTCYERSYWQSNRRQTVNDDNTIEPVLKNWEYKLRGNLAQSHPGSEAQQYTVENTRTNFDKGYQVVFNHQLTYILSPQEWEVSLKRLYRERPELIPRGMNDQEFHALFALERYSEAWNIPKVKEECKTLIVRKCQQKIETHVWKSTIADDRMMEYYLDRAAELIQSFRNAEVQKALWATFEMTKTAKASVLDYAEKCEHPSSLKESTDFINLFQDHYIQTKLKKEFNIPIQPEVVCFSF